MGLSLTVFELLRLEVWPHFRAQRAIPRPQSPHPPAETGNFIIRPSAVASRFTRASHAVWTLMSACQSVLLYVVGWTLLLLVITVVHSQKLSTFVDILCQKSSSFGNSRIVRRERIFCVIHRELATIASSIRTFGALTSPRLNSSLVADWWWLKSMELKRWCLNISEQLSHLHRVIQVVNCVRRSVELLSFSDADYWTSTRIRRHFGNFI